MIGHGSKQFTHADQSGRKPRFSPRSPDKSCGKGRRLRCNSASMEAKDRKSAADLGEMAQDAVEAVAGGKESPVNQEADVAGPLTLEEAKAVGDVPEDFKVPEEKSEGFLKRATHMFMGETVPQIGDEDQPPHNPRGRGGCGGPRRVGRRADW